MEYVVHKYDRVSIHAPAKGATIQHTLPPQVYPGFNPRAREGRDFCSAECCKEYRSFNPRAREGRDVLLGEIGILSFKFQSTRPRRARHQRCAVILKYLVSIHAPAKGATDGAYLKQAGYTVSIHAPAKGATYRYLQVMR